MTNTTTEPITTVSTSTPCNKTKLDMKDIQNIIQIARLNHVLKVDKSGIIKTCLDSMDTMVSYIQEQEKEIEKLKQLHNTAIWLEQKKK